MNSQFLEYISDVMWECLGINCDILNQEQIKDILSNAPELFPMICYEKTSDNDFTVDLDESNFLNDESHEGRWLLIYDDDDCEEICVFNLKEIDEKTLEIDVFEMSEQKRGFGYAREILEFFERYTFGCYEKITVNPFDTDSMNFWSHMGYINNIDGSYSKIHENYERED